ncbi:MAG: flagellar biosynthesis protein FlhA [Planctomycetes bacterium]|nr:flagellar biosynthesis protein FlhA [Planctomycetota bacterium]
MHHFNQSRDLLVAVFVVGVLAILFIPLPEWAMDLLLGINIMLSLVLLLTTFYVAKPIDFNTFPSLLLMATLFRLSLNIATTRLILGRAHIAGSEAAGKLIDAFGNFVSGDSIAIGLTIFVILMVIQFVVITKGATRIAEVAARFTLDAMPGKQMAIDADLNAGLINEIEAKQRREDLRALSDFYGSMDGASKFVRGDAIAGIIITIINIMVGLIVGMAIHGMDFATAGKVFTTLTIGDGLVSQVPALLVSVGSGILVTRSATTSSFGEDVLGQLFSQKKALAIACILLTMLGFTGLVGGPFPSWPLILVGMGCGLSWYIKGQAGGVLEQKKREAAEEKAAEQQEKAASPEKVETYLRVDPMELEVGYGLVPLVDVSQSGQGGGGLLSRVQMIRQQMAIELGIIVPPIRIRDNIQLNANEYVIKIQGSPVASGSAEPDKYLAMDSGMATEPVEGIETTEPAFNLPAVWVTEGNREKAERSGYTVVDAETVVATHLTEIIKSRSHELLTREEVRRLLDNVREQSPNLVQEVVPDLLSLADVQKVLQNLLRERVSIRNLPAILEGLGDLGRRTKDPDILTEYCRNSMGRWLCNEFSEDGKLYVVTLDPKLEDVINQHIEHTDGGSFLSLRPAVSQKVVGAISEEVARQLQGGHNALLLTSPQIRKHVKRMTESSLSMLTVMSYNEILPDFNVESLGMVSVNIQ